MNDKVFGGLLGCLLLLSMSAWGLGPDAQAIKDEGMIDYNLGYVADAIPELDLAEFLDETLP